MTVVCTFKIIVKYTVDTFRVCTIPYLPMELLQVATVAVFRIRIHFMRFRPVFLLNWNDGGGGGGVKKYFNKANPSTKWGRLVE